MALFKERQAPSYLKNAGHSTDAKLARCARHTPTISLIHISFTQLAQFGEAAQLPKDLAMKTR